jgi:hypothetical protein
MENENEYVNKEHLTRKLVRWKKNGTEPADDFLWELQYIQSVLTGCSGRYLDT